MKELLEINYGKDEVTDTYDNLYRLLDLFRRLEENPFQSVLTDEGERVDMTNVTRNNWTPKRGLL